MRQFAYVLAALTLCVVSIVISKDAQAFDKDDVIFEIGVNGVTGTGEGPAESEGQIRGTLGYGNIYLFGTKEGTDLRLLGQGYGEGDLKTFGLGFQYELAPSFNVFAEGGWGMLDYSTTPAIVDEITYTVLANHHANEGRPIPYGTCNAAAGCNREYELTHSDGWVARVGVKWEPIDHWLVTVSYRAMTSSTYIANWDIDRKKINPATGTHSGYWEERFGTDLGAFEFGVALKW